MIKLIKIVMLIIFTLVLSFGCKLPMNPDSESVTPTTVPTAISNLVATPESSTVTRLNWVDEAVDETKYWVYWNTEQVFTVEAGFAELDPNTEEYLVTGQTPNTLYYYKVVAINDVGSSISVETEATTLDIPLTAPTAPSNQQLELTKTNEVTVTFDDNSTNEEKFVVAYSKDGFATSKTESVLVDTTVKIIVGLDYDSDYEFKTKAINEAGESVWTSIGSISTLSIMQGTMEINNGSSATSFFMMTINSLMENINNMHYKINEGSWSTWETYTDTKSFNASLAPDGIVTITVEYRNSFDEIISKTDSIIFDRTAPTINSVELNGGNWATSTRALTITNDVEGATKMCYSEIQFLGDPTNWDNFNSETTWNLSSSTGSKTLYSYFKDDVGNISFTSTNIFYLPGEESIIIDNGNSYTNSAVVNLTLSSSSAVEMLITNDDSSAPAQWRPFSTEVNNWTLSTGDEIKTVNVWFKDAAGNVTPAPLSDSINLDTTSPVINYVEINNDDATTYDRNVIVRISTNGNTISYSTDNVTWSSWEGISGFKNLSLFGSGEESANEDVTQTVYVKVQDLAGNITTASDSIIFDEVTVLKVTIDKISVNTDGDIDGSGEWKWGAEFITSYISQWYILDARLSTVSVDCCDTIHINSETTLTLINGPNINWSFRWKILEEDVFTDETVGTINVTYPYPFETGSFSEYLSGDGGSGYAHWQIERLDL